MLNKRIIKIISYPIIFAFVFFSLISCEKKDILYVYNWGLYIDERTISMFEDEYDVKVIYDTFDTNEEMLPIIESNARVYDVICPTDYMIEKMISKNLIAKIDYKNKLNSFKYLDKQILNLMKTFDSDNEYSIPYVYSTIGIIYNKTLLDEKNLPYPNSWSDLWKDYYRGEILMQEAKRDLLMVGLKKNNFSMNTIDKQEIDIATDDLIKQKPLVQAYVIDQVRDKMINGEAAIAVTYSGEVEYIKKETENTDFIFEYVLPKEGVNLTIDAWVIPENSANKDLAIKWIDFMSRPDIAYINFEYMTYGIPNLETMNTMIDKKLLNDEAVFPNIKDIYKYEMYKDLGEFESFYTEAWKKILSE